MRPPTGPYLIDHLFGLPFLTVRWYGVLIVSSTILAGFLATRRARARGIDAEHVWNQLLLGMLLGILGARIYYVAFEWQRYAGRPLLEIINPQGGGLAIHGAIVGALIAVLIYTRPTTLPWGLDIPPDRRIPPYDNLQQYPASTRFHPTFLYESLWDAGALVLILWIERRFRAWLRPGDSALLYGVLYSAGRFVTEGLRTDSLCVGAYTLDGSCTGGLRIAQLVSLSALVCCGLVLAWRHRRSAGHPEPMHPEGDLRMTDR